MEFSRNNEIYNSSYIERFFNMSASEIKREAGFSVNELERLRYSLNSGAFFKVENIENRQGLEILWHESTSTMIVPPPHLGMLSLEDLPIMALPVVGHIHTLKPDIVVGCDRGGRMYSIAVLSMWNRLRSKTETFPTLSSQMDFARLSTSMSFDVVNDQMIRILEKASLQSNRREKKINNQRPSMLFIDDLISSGATRRLILNSLATVGILDEVDVSFALMCGHGGDVSGRSDVVEVPWQDDPEYIGVEYGTNGVAKAVRSKKSIMVRKELQLSVDELAEKLAKKD